MRSLSVCILLLCSGLINAQFLEKEYEVSTSISQQWFEQKKSPIEGNIYTYSYYPEMVVVDNGSENKPILLDQDTNVSGSFYKVFEKNNWKFNAHFLLHQIQYLGDDIEQLQSKNVEILRLKNAYSLNSEFQFFLNLGVGFSTKDRLSLNANNKGERANAYGLDMGMTWKPNSRFSLLTSLWIFNIDRGFVYVDDEGIINTEDLNQRLGLDIETQYMISDNLMLNSNFAYAQNQNSVSKSLELSNEGYLEVIFSNNISGNVGYRYAYQNSIRKSSLVGDIGITYEVPNFSFEIGIQNLLNDSWYEPEFATALRLTNGFETKEGNYFVPDDALFFGASLTYNF